MKQFIFSLLLLILVLSPLYSTYLEEADELLRNKQTQEALAMYQKALGEDPTNEAIYIQISVAYSILKDTIKAIEMLKNGLVYADKYKHLFYYNMGINYHTLGNNETAAEMFGKAIETDPRFPDAYLNRADIKLNIAKKIENREERLVYYPGIISDLETYLALRPNTKKRKEIEDMIAVLKRSIKDKEDQEKELQNLLNILNNSSDTSKDITAGAEDIKVEYEGEDILD